METIGVSIDIITDYMVLFRNKLIIVSHHTIPYHDRLAPNASDWAIRSGGDYLVADDPSGWIGEKVDCHFFRSDSKHSLVIYAKSVREWDRSRPMYERKISEKKSAKWDEYYNKHFKCK